MAVKRRDFQKIASTIHQFLLKLTDTYECAELRDSLNMSLVQLQKYYRRCQNRLQHTGKYNGEISSGGYVSPRQSLRITLTRNNGEPPLSPMTPYIEEPNYFHVKWTMLDESNDKLWRQSVSDDAQIGSNMFHKSLNTPPMHYGAMTEDFELLNELYNEKNDVLENQDCIGRTPLMYAVFYCKIRTAKWLLQKGADPNSCDYNELTSIHWACYQGNCELIELLLEAGSYINNQDSFGRSACHWSCTRPNTECLQILLQYNVNVNLHDKNGLTPAMWACRLDNLQHLKTLLHVSNQTIDHIDGFERDRNGRTIIHWSIRRQSPHECLKYLLSCDMAHLRDDEGKTVLLLASEQGALESCKLIVSTLGTQCINDLDDKDRSGLHLATIGGHGEVVNFLLESGANIYLKDQSGATCLDIAHNQYLYYCQLIISSHIREKEKRRESEISDCVDLIERITSRHNSVSDIARTLPRTTKSPKSKSPKSPNSKRHSLKHSNTIDESNGFDIMSCDPLVERKLKNRKKGKLEENPVMNGEHHDELNSNNHEEISRFDMIHGSLQEELPQKNYNNNQENEYPMNNAEYRESIDYLNTDTGQEYHVDNNQVTSNSTPPILKPEINRRFQRAQKKNKLDSSNFNSPKRNQTPPSPKKRQNLNEIGYSNETTALQEIINDVSEVQIPSIPSSTVSTARTPFVSSLEPLKRPPDVPLPNNSDNSIVPKRKKKKSRDLLQIRPRDTQEGLDKSLSKSMENIRGNNIGRTNGDPLLQSLNSPSSSNRQSSPITHSLSPLQNLSSKSLLELSRNHQKKTGSFSPNNFSDKFPITNQSNNDSQPTIPPTPIRPNKQLPSLI